MAGLWWLAAAATGRRAELGEVFWRQRLFWLVCALALGAAVWLIFLIRTRLRGRDDPAEDDRQTLRQMADLHREGGLSDEEYRSIKGRLLKQFDDPTRAADG